MARPVDEKIVKMTLDNQDFRTRTEETVGIFGRLKDSMSKIPGVNFGKTATELGNIKTAAGGIGMDKLANAADTVVQKFSLLGTIGTTVLRNLTNKVTDSAVKFAKGLALDDITTGFKMYETKISSIQTILSNTQGKNSLDEIKGALAQLNEYSDKTVYSFSEMAANIGRFTAAGINLKDSTSAIQGISNLAAASGSTSQQASTAMYQLSQALSSGSMKLQDWNSVVNAGMGGKLFQDALQKTAKGMGKNIDKSKSFRESLQDGWLSSEVLLKTLNKFSTDNSMLEAATKVRTYSQLIDTTKEAIASGWSQSWELIIGDFNEASDLWSGVGGAIGGVISDSAKARNDLLKTFVAGGGMKQIIGGLTGAVTIMMKVFTAAGEGFKQIFPPVTAGRLLMITRAFSVFISRITLTTDGLAKIKTIFAGVASVFSSAFTILKHLGGAFKNLIPKDIDGGGILNFFIRLADMAIGFDKSLKSGNKITKFIDDLGPKFAKVAAGLGNVVRYIQANFNPAMAKMNEYYQKAIIIMAPYIAILKDKVPKAIDTVVEKYKSLRDFSVKVFASEGFAKVVGVFSKMGSALTVVKNIIGKIAGGIKKAFGNVGKDDLLGAGGLVVLVLIAKKIKDVIGKFQDMMAEPEKMMESIKGIFSGLSDSLGAFTASVKASMLLKIAIALGILAVSLMLLERMSWQDITKGLAAMAASLGGMMVAMNFMSKMNMKSTAALSLGALLIAMSIAIGLVAVSLRSLSKMSPKQMATGMIAISGIMAVMMLMLKGLNSQSKSFKAIKVNAMVAAMVGMSAAILILSASMRIIGTMKPETIKSSSTAIVVILAAIVGAFAIIGKIKPPSLKSMASFIVFAVGLTQVAVAMVIFGAAIAILLKSVGKMGDMKWEVLKQGLIGLGIIFAEIAIFQKIAGGTKMTGAAIGVALIAVALQLLLDPLTKIGKMDIKVLQQGLIGMGLALLGISVAMAISKGSMSGAVGIVIAAEALILLVPALEALGKMDMEKLGIGLLAMAGALVILVTALNLAKGTLDGALALIVASVALNLLVIPIQALSAIPMDALQIALLAIAGTLTIIGVAAMLLGPAIPALLGLAGGIALLGLAVLLAGGGLVLFGGALMTFASVSVVAVGNIVRAFGLLIDGVAEIVPKIGKLITALLLTICNVILENLPTIVTTAGFIIVALLTGVLKFLPDVIRIGAMIIIAILLGLATYMPLMVDAAVKLIISFVQSLSKAIRENGPALIKEILVLLGEIITIVVQALIAVIDAFIGWIPGVSEQLASASKAVGETIRENFDGDSLGVGMGTDYANGVGSTKGLAEQRAEDISDSSRIGLNKLKTAPIGEQQGTDYAKSLGGTSGESLLAGTDLSKLMGGGLMSVDAGDKGEEQGNAFADMLGGTDMSTMMESMDISKIMNTGLGSEDTGKTGKKKGDDYADALGGTDIKSFLKAKGVSKEALKGLDSLDATGKGKEKGSDHAKGLKSKEPEVKRAARSISDSAKTELGSAKTFSTGVNLVDGVIDGANSRKSALNRAASRLAGGALGSMNQKFEVASPSKATTRMGIFLGQGLIGAFKKMGEPVANAAGKMAKRSVKSMNDFIGGFAGSFEKSNEIEVKLKPVMDFKDLAPIPDQQVGLRPDTKNADFQFRQVANAQRDSKIKEEQRIERDANLRSTNTNNTDNKYEINITAQGDLPQSTIKRMASRIQTEIKNANDRDKMSRGELVSY